MSVVRTVCLMYSCQSLAPRPAGGEADPGLPKGKAEVTRGREPGPCSHLVKPQASWRMGPSHLPCLTEDSKILLDYPGSNKIAVFLLAESTVNFK